MELPKERREALSGGDWLCFDPETEVARIVAKMRNYLRSVHRKGYVLGVSGGIDSSVCAALAARAVGRERVLALEMPERHSSPETLPLSGLLVGHLGICRLREGITPILEAVRFYQRYDEAVRSVIPRYGEGWKSKLVVGGGGGHGFSFFSVTAQSPEGETVTARLPLHAYLEILSATNFKQRTRKMLEYYHADRENYAVLGTPNRLEYDQGFFVKLGDGAADMKPIAHLYKTQVYRLAEYLDVPAAIRSRPPTTDTYSLPQGQDEFYFALPYHQLDLCLYALNNGIPAEEAAKRTGLSAEQVEAAFRDIVTKRERTRYLHLPPAFAESVAEVASV